MPIDILRWSVDSLDDRAFSHQPAP